MARFYIMKSKFQGGCQSTHSRFQFYQKQSWRIRGQVERKRIFNLVNYIGQIEYRPRGKLRQLCAYKDVEIIEAHAMRNHIHMLVKIAVSSFMRYLKGKSSLMIFEKHANLKYKYGNRNFWAKGYYVSTVGLNTKVVEEYIRNQEKEDMIQDNLSKKEYVDPFKG